MLYMVTFTINIPTMLAYIPYMDPMGYSVSEKMGGPQHDHLLIILVWTKKRKATNIGGTLFNDW